MYVLHADTPPYSFSRHSVPFQASCRRLVVPLLVVRKHGRNVGGGAVVRVTTRPSRTTGVGRQERIQLLRRQQLNDFARHATAAGIVLVIGCWSTMVVTAIVQTRGAVVVVVVAAIIHTSHRRRLGIHQHHVSRGYSIVALQTAASFDLLGQDQGFGGMCLLEGPPTKVGTAFGGIQQAGDVGVGL